MAILLQTIFALLYAVIVIKSERVTVNSPDAYSTRSTLELVHVIFRHGDRTPDGSYPTDPHANETYFPIGLGQLTNTGIMTAYNVGIALRRRYGSFIGKLYTWQLLQANASPVDRCQASMQAALAGLFPPRNENVWNTYLNWQPISFTTIPLSENKIFLSVAVCPKFFANFFALQATGSIAEAFKEYESIMEYMHKNSGVANDPFSLTSALYGTLKAQEDWGLTLPSWAQNIWPEPLSTINARMTTMIFAPPENRALGAGFLMSKIINDTKLTINNDETVEGRKLYLYAGHESNISGILAFLGVLEEHNPEYGAYIVIEVHNLLGTRCIKILYQNYESSSPIPIFIPGCGYYCPIGTFESLFSDYLNPYDLCV